MKTTIFAAAAAALLLAGCSEPAPAPEAEAEAERETLTAGGYEVTWTVAELGSTDRTTPATELAVGATGTASGCVSDQGDIDPALFALAGQECTPSSSYARGGRINIQMECRSAEQPGQIMQSVNGTSTADSLEGEVSTTTYLSGPGDYEMKRTFTGRRVGECPPAAPEGADAEGNAAGAAE